MYISFLLVLIPLSCSGQPAYPDPPLKGSEVVIDRDTLPPESLVFFTFRYHGKKVNFFVLRTHDTILSFLDACSSCYPSRRGYRIKDGCIVCRACDVRYAVSDLEKGFGGCFPIRVEGHLQAGKYLIPVSLLEEAADKF